MVLEVSTTLLIVDDDPAILRSLGRFMGVRGFDVRTAPTPEQALEQLRSGPFDAVLSDFRLGGGLDGVDVLAAARELHPEALLMLMTGSDLVGRIRRAVGTTIDRAFRKPLELGVVTDLLHAHARARRVASA